MLRYLVFVGLLAIGSGCQLLPDVAHKPTLHNPFPQLSRVAIAPFFNASNEPTVDGRQFAIAYFNELQNVPGFEVVPVGIVETEIRNRKMTLNSAADAQRLARALNVDAIAIGVVTDYSPYYPPRLGMQVKWYAANPGFHSIPPGYGLPWGTEEEENIPASLVFASEMALAKEQLKTQTPDCTPQQDRQDKDLADTEASGSETADKSAADTSGSSIFGSGPSTWEESARLAEASSVHSGIPSGWPDPRGFVPPPPSTTPPTCWPTDKPVMELTKNYNGADIELTEALSSYHYFRDDARFGGWQSYLQRSQDYISFCCHMHIWEMLSARGGAGKTRVVWRWETIR
jgi:hypothetical protein